MSNINRDEDVYFNDGQRRIDFVLAYKHSQEGSACRDKFEELLRNTGFILETESYLDNADVKTRFVKIHAPWHLLTKYAEILALKMPVKVPNAMLIKSKDSESRISKFLTKKFNYRTDLLTPPSTHHLHTAPFIKAKEHKFVIEDQNTFFSPALRSMISWQIIQRVHCGISLNCALDNPSKLGIKRLLNNGVYSAAYSLHDGPNQTDKPDKTDRQILFSEWTHLRNLVKTQPLHLIRRYFGDKVALYFAWLGFYNQMLIAPAFVGVIVFLYGCTTVSDPKYNPVSAEICDPNKLGKIKVCPECEKLCPFRNLGDSCILSKLSYVFDNEATVFFALFMSLWASVFMAMWKRREAKICFTWELETQENIEQNRPEYETLVRGNKINPVTKKLEPYLPAWNKSSRVVFTYSLILMMLASVFAAVLAVIFYRIVVLRIIIFRMSGDEYAFSKARIFASGTAATLNLIFIVTLNRIYTYVAIWLVNFERPRTQSEFEQSFTFKMFLFQCINFYSSILYIAFFKGRFFQHPGEQISKEAAFDNFKEDKCDTIGCWYELSIQLSFIMFGKQIFNNIMEIVLPKCYNWWRRYLYDSSTPDQRCDRKRNRWEIDYNLQEWDQLNLFNEMLEMVVQYGFVTLFVAAFPLAPFLALINNIFEIRIDAHKFLVQTRRPIAQRAKDLGAWTNILQTISYLAIVTNALVIAVTSQFINRWVYTSTYSEDGSLAGFNMFMLTAFNTKYWSPNSTSENWPGPQHYRQNADADNFTCYFSAQRLDGPHYELSEQYIYTIMAKFAFVLIFEHVMFAVVGIISASISSEPEKLRKQVEQRNIITREALWDPDPTSPMDPSVSFAQNYQLNLPPLARRTSESRSSTPVQNVHLDSLPIIQVNEEDYNPRCPALFDDTVEDF